MSRRTNSESTASDPRTSIPRRRVLSDSLRILAASGAVMALPANAPAATADAAASATEPRSGGSSSSGQRSAAASASSSAEQARRGSGGAPQPLNPPTVAATRGYSQAMVVSGGKTVYLSGQVSLDRTGKLVGEGNLKAQAQQVFENLKAVLEAAGGTFADVVKLNIYMLDASQVQVVRDVRDTFIKADAPPASTLVEVRRLVRAEFLLEIDAIAHIGTTV